MPTQTLAAALIAPPSYPRPPRVRSTGARRSKRRWLAHRLVRAAFRRHQRTPFTPEWLALPPLCRVGVSFGVGVVQGIRSGLRYEDVVSVFGALLVDCSVSDDGRCHTWTFPTATE